MTTTPAAALTPAELLTPDLQRQTVRLSNLDQGVLQFFDDDRRLTQRPTRDVVRLTLSPPPEVLQTPEVSQAPEAPLTPTMVHGGSVVPVMWVELVDGQRLAGRWTAAARSGEAMVWTHPTLGKFTIALDDVRTIFNSHHQALQAAQTVSSLKTDDDVIVMVNGDRLSGFVVSISKQGVSILPEGASDEVSIPLASVRCLSLANPASDAGVEGDLVALTDGSRVRGTGASIHGGRFEFTPALADAMLPVELGLAQVKHIDFAASGVRLVDLADQPMQVVSGGEVFGLPWPPTVTGHTIRLHAPVTVRFVLPAGAYRFAATAELDLPEGLPTERSAWADMLLWIGERGDDPRAGASGPPLRFRLAHPTQTLNMALIGEPTTLTLELDPGANGPVLDRLRLRDAVLLLKTPNPRPGTGDADR